MDMDTDVISVAHALMQDLDTPRSLKVAIQLRYQDWEGVRTNSLSPHQYLDCPSGVERLRRDLQAFEFLRKYDSMPNDADLDSEAVTAFYNWEKHCFSTNQRLSLVLEYPQGTFETAAYNLYVAAKKLVHRWLGPVPNDLVGRFGPGTSFEAPKSRRAYTQGDKYNAPYTMTRPAQYLVERFVWSPNDNWRQNVCRVNAHPWNVVPGNRFTTVPKDSKTRRGICIEPGSNLYLQLAAGKAIGQRLSRIGIHIPTGQERHGKAVMAGSVDGSLTTIDLSGASDTVSLVLVEKLLPYEWFRLLGDLRSPKTWINGRWLKLEKFSSMGNGYTFELETLLFLAIVCAATGLNPGDVLVYGDDIIIPREQSRNAIAALRFFGFIPNERKTFTSGKFLESCGSDFFCGEPVRPFYLKRKPQGPESWIIICNGLTRTRKRAWVKAHSKIPRTARCYGPSQLGDLLIHTDDRSRWTYKWRHQVRWFRTWRPVTKSPIPLARFGNGSHLLLALSGSESSGLVPRNWVSGYKNGWVALS